MRSLVLKRVLDVSAATGLLVILAPMMVLAAFLVWIVMGRPVVFRQLRAGLQGQPFWLFKLRTMTNERDHEGNLLPDGQRLTRLGGLLRQTSIDELPELLDVLAGKMSLVGPRPLLMDYLDKYTPEQARRHQVKPGITGWAQINGRNDLSWEQKFELDVWYVDHWDIWVDIKIMFRTVKKVLKRQGVSAQGHPTVHEFRGTKAGT